MYTACTLYTSRKTVGFLGKRWSRLFLTYNECTHMMVNAAWSAAISALNIGGCRSADDQGSLIFISRQGQLVLILTNNT